MLAERADSPDPVVRVKRGTAEGSLIVLLYLPDTKGLFLRAVAFLGKSGLSVVDARIHTTSHGWALDTFVANDAFAKFASTDSLRKLERDFAAALTNGKPLPPAPKCRLSRRSRHFPTRPSVQIQPDESGRAFILNIVATDRLGLLYACLLYTSPSPRDLSTSRMPSSA